jgi:hypothetical protein
MQNGTLFTEDFLREGVLQTSDWQNFPASELETAEDRLEKILSTFEIGAIHNEADTEERVIYKVLEALGWEGLILRRNTMAAKGSEDIPDGLLLPDKAALALADKTKKPVEKFRHGIVICESKKWERGLDSGKGDEVPSTQMLRYLTRADAMSDGKILWGILTNGRIWRLYWQKAKSRSEQFLEFDLGALLGIEGYKPDLFAPDAQQARHLLKVFILMFRREAFLPTRDKGRTFHEVALEEGKRWEIRVAKDLSELTFDEVFPGFASALASAQPKASLQDVREAAMSLLYRLLFILYAEDRDLLPRRDKRYEEYGLFKGVRQDIASKIDSGTTFSAKGAHYWSHCHTLFRLIDEGDTDIGLPPYNGGLFDRKGHALLDGAEISDAAFAPLLDKLSRTKDGKFINYRDLSVQQLGSIYERLLEYEPVRDDEGKIIVRLNPFARKGSGSYYTPDELVGLIIEQTVGPLVKERREAFEKRAKDLKSAKTPVAERLAELKRLDLASALLELKVCDPAMGSGHFLVHLVDYLTDEVIEALADASAIWPDYVSPLGERIAAIRARILKEARAKKWTVRPDQLEDRMIARRMVLKRVIYGVDKNPMAVELAKVSLWLHTFTVGAPLSFLDHHLRCGDSLFGEWVLKTERELSEAAGMFVHNQVVSARRAARLMLDIEAAADADMAEVRKSEEAFDGVREVTDPLLRLLSFWHACRWIADTHEQRQAKSLLLQGGFGDIDALLTGKAAIKSAGSGAAGTAKKSKKSNVDPQTAEALLNDALRLSEQERFLHWEVAFPGVWADWESNEPKGGFDAVIGNPPWDRLKMQEVEWFAARKPEIALAQRAADRKRMIEKLKKDKDPLYGQYELAAQRADQSLTLSRDSGEYPLLGRGDVNIYSLFVERAQRLIKPDGIAGLLVPSGIASDKSAADFFRSIATSSRLSALLDFENRGREGEDFFPDVDSRFKFCAFVAAGRKRTTAKALCGFFLNGADDRSDPERCFALTPDDFALVNPNTGTAPIFRTRRDAEITTAIYKRVPILVKRDAEGEIVESTWPVRYLRMFDMTNDSHLFWTRERLEKDGAYPIAGSRWQKGKQVFVPLYVGKMVHQFDHRASSVGINPENVHVAGYSDKVTVPEHQNPDFAPTPQYWVDLAAVDWTPAIDWCFAFRDIARSTDQRTFIGTIVPKGAFGNTLPQVLGDDTGEMVFLAANWSSLALDFVARQKVQSTHLNWYIVEQLPVLAEKDYTRKFGKRKAADIVRDHVLRLSYTANDLADFARDMGHVDNRGHVLPPFRWDEEERTHLRARLDALYFLLYGITDREDVRYILSTFPGVREEDEKKHGRYRTEDLILAYMNALEAGDTETTVAL